MNKKILRTLTALCAALMLTGGFSVTAFAQTPEGEDATDDSDLHQVPGTKPTTKTTRTDQAEEGQS